MWLGVDEKLGLRGVVEVGARMHLTQAMAKQLIEVLQRFVDTGSIA